MRNLLLFSLFILTPTIQSLYFDTCFTCGCDYFIFAFKTMFNTLLFDHQSSLNKNRGSGMGGDNGDL